MDKILKVLRPFIEFVVVSAGFYIVARIIGLLFTLNFDKGLVFLI